MIRLERLHKAYGACTAVEPLTLEVAPGEVVALVGPNGAGKSTTLRALAGLIRPTSGHASIGGYDVVTEATAARSRLGYLPQRSGTPSATVLADLAALVAGIREIPFTHAIDVLAAAGLAERLDCTLGELSGGQRQRAMVALATVGPVTALLLDEPSISLDSEGSQDVRQAICRARSRGTAVLFASHHLQDVAVLADRIAVMVQGRLVAQGTLAQLAHAAGVLFETTAAGDSPIERIYHILVRRGRDTPPRHLSVMSENAA